MRGYHQFLRRFIVIRVPLLYWKEKQHVRASSVLLETVFFFHTREKKNRSLGIVTKLSGHA